MSSDVIRRRVRVHGLVQGVFFRASTHDAARAAGVAGWVRNRPDGSVEAVFEGAAEPVERMVAWIGEGPPQAAVERIEVVEEEPEGLSAFEVR
jgi:acylphosphatase